jgi:hypothetical protein
MQENNSKQAVFCFKLVENIKAYSILACIKGIPIIL